MYICAHAFFADTLDVIIIILLALNLSENFPYFVSGLFILFDFIDLI